MNLPLPAFAALALLAATAFAQEEAPGLIPELPEPPAQPKRARVVKEKSSTEQTADEMAVRIRLRNAKTKAAQDPKLAAAWTHAHAVKTDRERREALKVYYHLLYDAIIKVDRSLKPRVEVQRKALAWRFEQRGLKPSEVLEPEDDGPAFLRR